MNNKQNFIIMIWLGYKIQFFIYPINFLVGLLLSPTLKVLPIYKNCLQCLAPGGHELHQATFILLL